MSEERFDRIDSRLQVLEASVDRLTAELRTDVTQLKHYMGVIHEDLVDRIRGAAMPEEQLRREWTSGLGQLRDETDRRLRPLEVIVPQHSRNIEMLKKRRSRD
jgi:hypothetical protein